MTRLSAGMTLIEVMVALVLLSMLSVGLFISFSLGQRTYIQLVTNRHSMDDVVTAQRLLRGIVEAAYPLTPRTLNPHFGLEGHNDSFEVTAPAPGSHRSGFFRYRVSIATRDGRRNLLVSYGIDQNVGNMNVHSGSADAQFDEVLIPNIKDIQIAYMDLPEHMNNAGLRIEAWQTEWQHRQKLPLMVRVNVTFNKDDSRQWPELLAVPVVTDNARCEFDIVMQACRGAS